MGISPIFYLWPWIYTHFSKRTVIGLGYELVDVESAARSDLSRLHRYDGSGRGSMSRTAPGCRTSCRVFSRSRTSITTASKFPRRVSIACVKKAADFERFAGQDIQIKLRIPQGGRRNFQGELLGCRTARSVCASKRMMWNSNSIISIRHVWCRGSTECPGGFSP